MPPDPQGLSWLQKFFGHSTFKIELLALWSEASTEGILSNKCLLLVEYEQFQKEERRELHIAYWQLTTQLSFHEQQEFSEHKTWFLPYIVQ